MITLTTIKLFLITIFMLFYTADALLNSEVKKEKKEFEEF